MKVNTQIQSTFFNNETHQYKRKSIDNPPLHTKFELNLILKTIFKSNSCKKIVDFGAGTGRLTIPLIKAGYNVTAVDVSKKSLSVLQSNVKNNYKNRLKTTHSLVGVRKYDMFVGADILHHIDFDIYFPHFYFSLKQKGRILFSEPGALNISWYIFLPVFVGWEVEKGVLNCTYWNIKNKLKLYGFSNIKITGLGLFPRPFFNWFKKLSQINDWLGSLPVLKWFAY